MNLPECLIRFYSNHRVLSHIIFWLLLLIIQISSSSYYNADIVPFRNNLVGDGTNLLAQIPAAYFMAYFIVPRFFYQQHYAKAIAFFIAGAYIICVLSRIEVIHIEEPFYGYKAKASETYDAILTDIPKLVYVYFFRIFSVAFIFSFLKLLKDQLAIREKSLSLEKQKAATELQLLRNQLNPHFLFNTLNNIYSLSLSNSPAAPASIAGLSEILDYILYRCNSLYVPLQGEIDLLNNYIGLEKLRYGERLEFIFNCEQKAGIVIAPLLLLSLTENAFKHGASNETGKTTIAINLRATPDAFYFDIANPVCTDVKAPNNGKIGLENLQRQLDLVYPHKHKLVMEKTETMFKVIMTIDLS
jgi:hypothetical protein